MGSEALEFALSSREMSKFGARKKKSLRKEREGRFCCIENSEFVACQLKVANILVASILFLKADKLSRASRIYE